MAQRGFIHFIGHKHMYTHTVYHFSLSFTYSHLLGTIDHVAGHSAVASVIEATDQ